MSKKYSKKDVTAALQSMFFDMKENNLDLEYYIDDALTNADLCRYLQPTDDRIISTLNKIIDSYKQIKVTVEDYLPYLIALKSEIMKTYE